MNDVLDATLDLLASGGFAGLSFEAVADRAGVSRTTVYRRWPTKLELVRAALLRLASVQPLARDTGALRSDLLEFIRLRLIGNRRERERTKALLRANLAELGDPELLALSRLVQERAHGPITAAVERAVARGELPAGTDPALVVEPIFSTLHFHVLVLGEEPDAHLAEGLVDLVLAGARAGAAVRAQAGRSWVVRAGPPRPVRRAQAIRPAPAGPSGSCAPRARRAR